MIERRVGAVFSCDGKVVKVVENGLCTECFLYNRSGTECKQYRCIIGYCDMLSRKDGKSVIFKEVECEEIDVNKECDL